jgi:hypothetical protein
LRDAPTPFSQLPNLLFFRSYRPAADYVEEMKARGLRDVGVRDIDLDSPFFVVTGVKPGR